MKNRGNSICNHCKQKLIKSPTSLTSSQNKRSCNCKRPKSKQSALRNSSRHSDKSNSQSRHSVKPNVNQNLLLTHQSLPTQYQSYEQKSPRAYIDVGGGNTLTNLKISGCEFPMMQTARNPPISNLFQQDPYINQHHLDSMRTGMLQQPSQNFQSFSILPQTTFATNPQPSYQFQSYNSTNIANAASPFKRTQNFDTMASLSQMRSFSPGQRDFNSLTPSKQILTHYDRIVHEFELYSQQRAQNLRDNLQKIVEGLKTDDIIAAMREDPLSQNYAYQRMKEVVDNLLIAESEQVIANFRGENVLLREKILILEAENQKKLNVGDLEKVEKRAKHAITRKNHYKQSLKQSQEQINQLLNKFKEVEQEIQKQQSDYDIKIAQKDGELARCEKVLSEVRGMLSEKTNSQNKLENNLSNEVTMLNERIVSLEKERDSLIDKYQNYGEEFKQIMFDEQNQHQIKVLKYKDQIKDLKSDLEKSNNSQKCLEDQIKTYVKENEALKSKLEELNRQSQDKVFKLRDVEEKHILQEKDLSSQLREQKQKYKSKIKQLQVSFEQALQDKIHQLENETRDRIIQVENEKSQIEQKFTSLQANYESKLDEDKQNMIVMQKQMEKKLEKLQSKYEQEIQNKLVEAEEQFKELESRMRKEHKNEKKNLNISRDQEIEQQQQQVIQMQERYESEFRDMSLKLRENIDELQKSAQEYRIKIAELNILVDTHKAESERLARENEALQIQQRELISSSRREVQVLEEKLQFKIQENDDKVKLALDSAIKNSNLESIAKQYAHELDKKQQEIQNLKDQNQRINTKYEKALDESKLLQIELQSTKQLIYDKEFKLCRLQTVNKESLTKIFQFIKLQSSKYKQELEYLKRHFASELEMNKKNIESQLLAIISKAREISYTQKFKFEKLQYHYEQRFQKEFNAREAEWEKIWEKREDEITQKEKVIKDLENERVGLRETKVRQESEINQLKQQLQMTNKDLTKQYDEVKQKLQLNEQKHNELSMTYKRQEEQLVNQQRQQLIDLKMQMQQRSQDELRRIEQQMSEYREKSKQKMNDLAQHIQDSQTKHRHELINMKQVYEDKIKSLESDNDEKQRVLYESQNKINMLQIKYEQFIKDNEMMEKQIINLTQREKELSHQIAILKPQQEILMKERDDLQNQKVILEKDLKDLDTQNRTLQTQIYTAERKFVQQRNDLKNKMRKLHKSKQRELQEVQFLNDILTKNPTSSSKQLYRDRSVTSPDFKRVVSQNGFQTYRGAETQRLNLSSSNYGDILSEINNMIDAKQIRLSCSNGKSLLGKSQRFNNNIISSPSVGQLNPSMTFYHKSILKSPNNKLNKENGASMRISDLKE